MKTLNFREIVKGMPAWKCGTIHISRLTPRLWIVKAGSDSTKERSEANVRKWFRKKGYKIRIERKEAA